MLKSNKTTCTLLIHLNSGNSRKNKPSFQPPKNFTVFAPHVNGCQCRHAPNQWNEQVLWQRSLLKFVGKVIFATLIGKKEFTMRKKTKFKSKNSLAKQTEKQAKWVQKKKCWCEQEWNWPITCSGCSYQWTQVNLSLATHLPSLCCLHWQWINRNPFPRYNYMTDFFVRNLEASVAKVKCWKLPQGIIRLRHPKHSSHVSRVLVKILCFLSTN